MPSGSTLAIAGGGFFILLIVALAIIYFVTSGTPPSSPAPSTTQAPTTGGGAGTTPSAGTPSTGGGAGAPPTTIGTLGSLPSQPDSSTSTDGSTTPVNCVVSDWGAYSACTKTCGGGTMTKTRTVITPAANGGTACPPLTQTDPCNTQECPVDCEVSGWSDFSACSLPCGGGTQTRTRTVTKQPTFRGAACPPLTETQNCNTQGCPVDCVGSWAGCSVTCGEGIDTYRITTPAANGGKACTESDGATRKCVQPPCGVDCVGDWVKNATTDQEGWGQCSATCGSGTQTRTYKVTTVQVGSGKTCPYKDGQTETRQCPGLSPCPTPVDCIGGFGEWTGCSAGCGGGTRTRTYTITTAAANGGKACPHATGYKETEACNQASCCSAATTGEWYDVGSVICSGTASATPYIYQSRAVTFPSNPNGSATASACNITVARTRNTAIGCPAVTPSNGVCSDPTVGWTAEKGCSLDTPVDATSGTCNPSDVPWSKTNGCTLPSGDITPSGGTCSITGISWNATDGCRISPGTRTGTNYTCSIGSWNGSSCVVSPSVTTPTGGKCSQTHATWSANGCVNGPQVNATSVTCSQRTAGCAKSSALYTTGSNCIYSQYSLMARGICQKQTTTIVDNSLMTDWTCPSGYQKSTTKGKCDPIPASVSDVTCDSNYNKDVANNRCIAKSGTVTGIDCSSFAGYEADLTNLNCKAKTISINDITCPAGYSKDLTNNKCTPKTATVSDLTCPDGYNKSTSTNKCTAKAATITSLSCPNLFTSSLSQNKCVPSS
jgi:hypothetical protein